MKISSPHPSEKVGQIWTILKILNWTASYFSTHNIEQPRATAEVLLAHTLGLTRIDLYLRHDQPLQHDELARYKGLIKRRINSEPVAYITGEKEFWSMAFSVTPDVLIPRPDTECLVEAVLKVMPKTGNLNNQRVLELGTGSGAIAVALASERPESRIVALDRSMAALAIAKKNAYRHGLTDKICFLCSDWFKALGPRVCLDIIVSNPPYIKHDDIPFLQPEIHLYEPKAALDGGPEGLDAFKEIINRSKEVLVPGGYLFLEIGYDQKAALTEIVNSSGRYEPAVFYKDYNGYNRVAQLRLL